MSHADGIGRGNSREAGVAGTKSVTGEEWEVRSGGGAQAFGRTLALTLTWDE